MDKMQAYHSFWSAFTWKAYDETSVPDSAVLPYIAYEAITGYFGDSLAVTASLWTRSTSWATITAKEKEIAARIGKGGIMIPYEGGALWIRRGSPWAQRMSDAQDDSVRRIVLNVILEFID